MGRDLTTIPIQGYEEFYTISECGKIHRIARLGRKEQIITLDEPILINSRLTNGTITVNLHANKVGGNKSLSRLVYIHFKGKVSDNQVIKHIDENPFNYHIDNLEKIDFELHMSRKHLNKKK